jgi:hypothetical protein
MNGSNPGNLSNRRYVMACCFLLLACGLAQNLAAHQRSESFSRWQYSDDILSVRFTISGREASRLQKSDGSVSLQTLLANYLAGQIFVQNDPRVEEPVCVLIHPFRALRSRPGFVQAEAVWQCRELPDGIAIHAFFDLAAEHSHFASLESTIGFSQRLLTSENRLWTLAGQSTTDHSGGNTSSPFTDYLLYGVAHISSGFDHLAFLVALLLLCRRGKDVVWAVSGFTLGHSITLTLAVLGLAHPDIPAVEATIGLTIALVVVERTTNSMKIAWPLAGVCAVMLLLMIPLASTLDAVLDASLLSGLALFSFCYLLLARDLGSKGGFRILITTLFGLIHGLGFAGAFLASDLDKDKLFLPLAGFNIGIELGQLALIAVMLSIGVLLKRRVKLQAFATELTSAVICGLGVFWFVQRGFFY